jgi:enediyne biosynthesis protein E4
MLKLYTFIFLLLLINLWGCKNTPESLFTQLPADRTGITFANRIIENDTMNIIKNEYIYNGGGVALGDFNNDNLTDVYFSANTAANRLYLNKGDFKFEDVTQTAKVDGQSKWTSGITVVDINNDHKLDIYVCATVRHSAQKRANLLYVNQGNDSNNVPIFKEMAQEYGIADTTHTTTAAFFDYDNDGDLDLYLVVNEMNDRNFPNKFHDKIKDGTSPRTDRLYRNDGVPNGKSGGFKNVSKEAGILIEGYGLGVNICDINRDGWKDIYVTNDFLTNDLLYINNQDGTFTDRAATYFKHTSYSAMGNDVSDINNDGLADVIAVDMMPHTNQRKKMMIPANSYVTYYNNEKFGYQHQYPRNTLQLNQGINPTTQRPVFSEIGLLAGIAETDWSWAPMVVDFDNDGWRDIIVTNGFPRDITDQDFLAYRNETVGLVTFKDLLPYIPSIKIKNFAFRNQGNLRFEDLTDAWGIKEPSFSNGAAYADLDNDGDLDYIVNNINDSAGVFRNNLIQQKPEESNYLRVKFKGNALNTMGLGAIVEIQYAQQTQVYEHTPYRGYLSSVEPIAHFGLGKTAQITQLKVTWQSGKSQILKNLKVNQVITLEEKNANISQTPDNQLLTKNSLLFKDITDSLNLDYKHQEIDAVDFNAQILLPHKLSQYGPALAVGDVNGDNLEDIFVGGSREYKGIFLIQMPNGKFKAQDLLPGKAGAEKISEDMGVLLFDADNDKDLDLYIVSGSYELKPNSPALADRFYSNDGKGNFTLNNEAIPQLLKSGSGVKAADFDQDGDLDLFVGGRVKPLEYPKPLSSYILRNDSKMGQIKFTDVSQQIAPQLQNIGLICDALWTDFDNDGWIDLLLAGEWMPLTFFKNQSGKFTKLNTPLDSKIGWWNSLVAGDFDNDGDMDYLAGNLGINTLNQANDQQPVSIYAKDFNTDGNYDAIPSVFYRDIQGKYKEFPFNSRDDLGKQFVQTRKRFVNYSKFSDATVQEILKPEELKDALVIRANWLKNSYLENQGKGNFALKELPIQAQFAPIFGMTVQDFDQDGFLDVLAVGNDFSTEVSNGRYDAFNGLVLKGNGKGEFSPLSISQSGFCVSGDAKSLVKLVNAQQKLITIASQNRASLKFFEYTQSIQKIDLMPTETTILIQLKNGKTRREEVQYGSSFLSQSTHSFILTNEVQNIEIIDSGGQKRKVKR